MFLGGRQRVPILQYIEQDVNPAGGYIKTRSTYVRSKYQHNSLQRILDLIAVDFLIYILSLEPSDYLNLIEKMGSTPTVHITHSSWSGHSGQSIGQTAVPLNIPFVV